MNGERVLLFSDLEKSQLETSALKVQVLRCKLEAVQAQAQFLGLAIPQAEREHNALLEEIKATHVAKDRRDSISHLGTRSGTSPSLAAKSSAPLVRTSADAKAAKDRGPEGSTTTN